MAAFDDNIMTTCAVTALLAVALSACGGGDNGSTQDQIRAGHFRDAAHSAAKARPNPGSVTQSANVDSRGVTTDSVNVDVEYGEAEHTFSVRNRSSWSINSNEQGARTTVDNSRVESLRGSVLQKRLGGSATLTVALLTDMEGTVDADYLSFGHWIVAPDNANDAGGYEYGVFVDGSDPFQQANIGPLENPAIYEGLAGGLFISGPLAVANLDYGPGAVEDNFDGELRLTANFGNASELGTIGGTIVSTSHEGTLFLESTAIGSQNSGFSEGDLRGTIADIALSGVWGGQFYGNGQPGDYPGSVAGTFGGASETGAHALIGIYFGHRQ